MPTPNMNLTLPTEGGDNDVWDTILNNVLDLVDAHDHTTGKGVKVPMSALNVNADLPFNSGGTYYALTGVKAIDFQPRPTSDMTSFAGALFCNSADNELYWRTTGGANVKLTNGTSINASLIGGIGGDYASIGALLDYDDATDTYRFRQEVNGGVRQYGRVAHADLDLYEHDPAGDVSVPANRVRIKSPDTLAGSYDITWLAALPGSTQIMQVSSAGQLSASNTIANATSFSALATFNGAAAVFNEGLSVPTAKNVTLAGTAEVKHGDRVLSVDAAAAAATVSGTSTRDVAAGYSFTAAGVILIGFPFKQGDRIKSITLARRGDAAADITAITAYVVGAGGVATSIGTTSETNPPAAWADTTINVTDTTLAAGEALVLQIDANATGIQIGTIRITYDRP